MAGKASLGPGWLFYMTLESELSSSTLSSFSPPVCCVSADSLGTCTRDVLCDKARLEIKTNPDMILLLPRLLCHERCLKTFIDVYHGVPRETVRNNQLFRPTSRRQPKVWIVFYLIKYTPNNVIDIFICFDSTRLSWSNPFCVCVCGRSANESETHPLLSWTWRRVVVSTGHFEWQDFSEWTSHEIHSRFPPALTGW